MSTTSKLYWSADCDGCDQPFENDDYGVVLGDSPEEIVEMAMDWEQWVVHRGQLLCGACIEPLAEAEHDFVTIKKTAPFCAICKQLPDALHPNVPMAGQLAIGEAQT
jgi:hypothetical protein